MNDTVGQARDDVRARLAEIATSCGISEPQLRLVPGHAAASGCLWRADQPEIVLGTAQLRDLSAPGLDGTLAHECAHIFFRDPGRARSRGSVAGAAVFFTSAVLGALSWAALVWLWLRISLHWNATAVGILLGAFAGLVIGGALGITAGSAGSARLERRSGRERWRQELRADLLACQLVGNHAAAAAVREALIGRDRSWLGRRRDAAMRSLSTWLNGRTHPPAEYRLAAIQAYDSDTDPEHAARDWLHQARLTA